MIDGREINIIDMYLDLYKLELSFKINGVNYGKAFDVDGGYEYVAGVSIGGCGDKVTLITHDSAVNL